EVDLGDRDFDPVGQEVPRPQRRPGNRIALQRACHCSEQPRLHRLAEGRGQRVTRNAEPISKPDHPLPDRSGRRLEAGERQGPPRRNQFSRFGGIHQRLGRVVPERNSHRLSAVCALFRYGPHSGHEPIARGQFGHASPLSPAMFAAERAGPPVNVAEPATGTAAPALAHCRAVSALTPPSTSSRMSRPDLSIILRTASTLRSWLAMKLCPPKPGLTLITRTKSISSIR